MRRALFLLILPLFALPVAAQDQPTRPPIIGIAHVRIFVTQMEASVHFYQSALGLTLDSPCSIDIFRKCFRLSELQLVQLDSRAKDIPANSVEEVAFLISDVAMMRKFVISRGVQPDSLSANAASVPSVCVSDPEGHHICFEQRQEANLTGHDSRVSKRLIHTGFIVHDRAAEDKFYEDILGFHVYWHGGMKEGEDNWVDMQVPDGTDWIEYMLKVPANADKHTLGVMNHIALGVPDIHAAEKQLRANGWNGTEQPKIGRDGKWQLNLYDPDETRVELMEFTPVQKPCCSDYTGPHPKP
jgi:catechol 2,3-dioxygenase-like lactoylglutathione lyase family enzyme